MPILHVKDENGNFVEIPALKGNPGKTPLRGVDYWTEEDQEHIVDEVLGVVQDPELELIETIVCDGTYGNISRTGLLLKRAVLYINTKAADVAASYAVEVKNEEALFGYLWVANGVNTAERWCYVNAVSDGKGAAYLEGTAAATSNYGTAAVYRTANRLNGNTPIIRIGIYTSGGINFPEGSTIEIRGVRANA